jgi:hypothetical protein
LARSLHRYIPQTAKLEDFELSIDQAIEIRGRRGRIAVHRWSATTPRFVALLAHGYDSPKLR